MSFKYCILIRYISSYSTKIFSACLFLDVSKQLIISESIYWESVNDFPITKNKGHLKKGSVNDNQKQKVDNVSTGCWFLLTVNKLITWPLMVKVQILFDCWHNCLLNILQSIKKETRWGDEVKVHDPFQSELWTSRSSVVNKINAVEMGLIHTQHGFYHKSCEWCWILYLPVTCISCLPFLLLRTSSYRGISRDPIGYLIH